MNKYLSKLQIFYNHNYLKNTFISIYCILCTAAQYLLQYEKNSKVFTNKFAFSHFY